MLPPQAGERARQGRSPRSTLQQKVEAREKVGAGDGADQVWQQLLGLHRQKDARHVADVQREREPCAQPYGMSAAEGHRRFRAGELGDSAEVMEWRGLYHDQ